ncbi:MAG: alpha/beta hydrolase [Bacteroidetes bacterium]|nr:alpha/beta hydrolase [Bacteroidota bacterium]
MSLGCSSQRKLQSDTEWNYQEFRESQKSFQSSDGEIKYIDQGGGNVILLLHGVPTSSWVYRKMIGGLVEGGYRVIAPDMLGFGSSDNPKGYDIYSAEQHGKRIIELMDSLQIDEWTHVMHDAGGIWTWELLKNSPDRITNLILLNTIIYEEGFNPPIRIKEGGLAKFSMWLYKNGVSTNLLLKQLFKIGLKENNLTKSEIDGYRKPLREGKTLGFYYFLTTTCIEFPNYDSTIQQVKVPVTVIWGEHDEMLKFEPQREKVMKGLKVKTENIHIIDAKHFIQEEMPGKVDSLILEFIKE